MKARQQRLHQLRTEEREGGTEEMSSQQGVRHPDNSDNTTTRARSGPEFKMWRDDSRGV